MQLMDLFSVLARMHAMQRFSMTQLTQPESVMAHTGMVALTSLLIATECNTVAKQKIDISELLTKALLHDIEEVITGDTPRPTKYESSESVAMFAKMKVRAIARVLQQLQLSREATADLRPQYNEAKSLTTITGIIVALADLLAVVYTAWSEVLLRHNHSLLGTLNVRPTGNLLRRAVQLRILDDDVRFYLLSLLGEVDIIMQAVHAQRGAFAITIKECFDGEDDTE